MSNSVYFNQATGTAVTNLFTVSQQDYYPITGVYVGGEATFGNEAVSGKIETEKGKIHPILAFKFIKKKFTRMERSAMSNRLKLLNKAFDEAVAGGQYAFGEKILKEFSRETRETAIYAKGIRHYVERSDIGKVKNKIKGGHISDTRLENYTRIIPKQILKKKKALEEVFDGFVIYHYWDDEAEKKRETKQKMTPDEKSKLKDPIIFGWIKETDRLYFVADWEDEYCDLTFDEMVAHVADHKLTKKPQMNLYDRDITKLPERRL